MESYTGNLIPSSQLWKGDSYNDLGMLLDGKIEELCTKYNCLFVYIIRWAVLIQTPYIFVKSPLFIIYLFIFLISNHFFVSKITFKGFNQML